MAVFLLKGGNSSSQICRGLKAWVQSTAADTVEQENSKLSALDTIHNLPRETVAVCGGDRQYFDVIAVLDFAEESRSPLRYGCQQWRGAVEMLRGTTGAQNRQAVFRSPRHSS
jgi:hypothetical protein